MKPVNCLRGSDRYNTFWNKPEERSRRVKLGYTYKLFLIKYRKKRLGIKKVEDYPYDNYERDEWMGCPKNSVSLLCKHSY